ncbi:MAG: hypothetical protein C4583_11785 [Anaerolineaceae bacterium]|nr:MAG: hypothetical protein C4583_11785 [Anaerolineaceae bacterium]
MKILTVEIGTGTQDIFLYDSNLDLENGLKLILPSPTLMVHRRLKQALRARTPILLNGYQLLSTGIVSDLLNLDLKTS